MTQRLPDREKRTCLMSACPQKDGFDIHLHKLGKSARPLARSLRFAVSQKEMSRKQISEILTYLGASQIIHFANPQGIRALDRAITEAGFKPLDNAIFDAAPLAKAFCRIPGLPENPSLDDFAELRGTPHNDRKAAQTCPEARNTILGHIWRDFVFAPLGYTTRLDIHKVPPPRDIDPIYMSHHGLPLPAPVLPDIPTPFSGWRHTPWGLEEARDCALRFVEGASFEDLSLLLRRSPRAIRSRLILDGILQPV
jgi:hypothetical protein